MERDDSVYIGYYIQPQSGSWGKRRVQRRANQRAPWGEREELQRIANRQGAGTRRNGHDIANPGRQREYAASSVACARQIKGNSQVRDKTSVDVHARVEEEAGDANV